MLVNAPRSDSALWHAARAITLLAATAASGAHASEPFICAGADLQTSSLIATKSAQVRQEAPAGTRNALVIFADYLTDGEDRSPPAWAADLWDYDTPGSLSHFYDSMSIGVLALRGEVAPRLYQSTRSVDEYLRPRDDGFGRFGEFSLEILARADSDVDFSRFDNDGPDGAPNSGDDDGVVDAVFVILPRVPAGFLRGRATGISNLGFEDPYVSDDLAADGEPIVVRPDQGTVQRGATLGEAVGTVAHEYGHILGLPDLFNTEALAAEDLDPALDSAGIGSWGLMGWGALGWNGGDGPTSFSAWSRMELGWADVVMLDESQQVRFSSVAAGGTIYRIPMATEALNQEYFLVENRRRRDNHYDRGIPGEGLLVWHVRDRPPDAGRVLPPVVDLECADGRWLDAGFPVGQIADAEAGGDNLDFWAHDEDYARQHAGNLGDATDPFDGVRYTRFGAGTNPASLTRSGLSFELTRIRMVEGEQMLAQLTLPPPRIELIAVRVAGEHRSLIRTAGRDIPVIIELAHRGGARAIDLTVVLRSEDPLVEVLSPRVPLPDLRVGDSGPIRGVDDAPRFRVAQELAETRLFELSVEVWHDERVVAVSALTVEIQPGHLLSGIVRDADGLPVPEATIRIQRYEGPAATTTIVTDARGEYSVALPAGTYSAWVESFGDLGATFTEITLYGDAVQDFGLPRIHRLRGVVRNPSGEPMAGLQLQVLGGSAWHSVATNADGAFGIDVVEGAYRLQTARTTDYPSLLSGAVEVDDDTYVEIDLVEGVELSILVTDAQGNGISGLSVFVRMALVQASRFLEESIPMGSDGSGTMAVTPGLYEIWMEPPTGFARPSPTSVHVVGDTAIHIALQAGVRVSGRLTSPKGEPVLGSVTFVSLADGGVTRARADDDGAYVAYLSEGEYRVSTTYAIPLSTGNYLLSTELEHLLTVDSERELDFTLRPLFEVSGRAATADGRPLRGRVRLEGLDVSSDHTATVGPAGGFAAVLPVGRYRAVLHSTETGRTEVVREMTLESGGETDLQLRTRPTHPVEVVVPAADGQTTSSMSLMAVAMDGTVLDLSSPEDGGVFRPNLPAGAYRLYLREPVRGTSITWAVGRMQVPGESITVHRPVGPRLSGRVTDATGVSAGAQIYLMARQRPGETPDLERYVAFTSTAGEGGRYELEAPPGTYDLAVVPSSGLGRVTPALELTEDRFLDLSLPPGGAFTLFGHVLDVSGNPALNARVLFADRESGSISVVPRAWSGIYSTQLPAGTYSVSLAEWGGAAMLPAVSAGQVVVTHDAVQDLRPAAATGVGLVASSDVPAHSVLEPAYPNPFNGATVIAFSLAAEEEIRILVYNLLGQRVAQLTAGRLSPGSHRVTWDGRDDAGRRLASGVYVYELRTESLNLARRLALVR